MITFTTPRPRASEGCAELRSYSMELLNENATLVFRVGYMDGNSFVETQGKFRVFVSNLDPGADMTFTEFKTIPLTNLKDVSEVQKAIEEKVVAKGILPAGTVSLAAAPLPE